MSLSNVVLLLLLPLLVLAAVPVLGVSFVDLDSLSFASFPDSRELLPSSGTAELVGAWCARGGGAMMLAAVPEPGLRELVVCSECVFDPPFDPAVEPPVVLLLLPLPVLLPPLVLLTLPPGRRLSDIRSSFLSFVMGTAGQKGEEEHAASDAVLLHVV